MEYDGLRHVHVTIGAGLGGYDVPPCGRLVNLGAALARVLLKAYGVL